MVDAPEELAEKVRAWGLENIPEEALYTDAEEPGEVYGRESHIHATVAYGIDPATPRQDIQGNVWYFGRPIKVKLGAISKFEPEKYDVIKFEVLSQDLREFHQQLELNLGLPGNTHPEYQPHVTVAYVKKGSCDHLLGQTPFEFEANLTQFDYSAPPAPGQPDEHTKYDLAALQPQASIKAGMREEVMQAIGEASMAWFPRPSFEVFDAGMAERIANELMDKITIWKVYELYSSKFGHSPSRNRRIFAGLGDGTQIEFCDRYTALGIPHPDPKTMCKGQCEGTGFVPVKKEYTDDPELLILWDEAESGEKTDDGWHFVICPECAGTGKAVALAASDGYDDEGIKSGKFWLSPEGECFKLGVDEEHAERVDFKGMDGRDPEALIADGWTRGGLSNNEILFLQTDKPIDWVLKKIPTEMLFAQYLEIESKHGEFGIPIDRGEDAEEAWRKRGSPNKKVMASIWKSFWLSPEGKLMDCGSWEHSEAILNFSKEVKKAWKNSSKDYSDPDVKDIAIDDFGWSRIMVMGDELSIDVGDGSDAETVLKKLPQKMLFCKRLVVDEKEVPVDEGEDALDAWRKRNSPRKRVRAAVMADDKFSRIYKEANKAAQADAKWANQLQEPSVAQEFGEFQSAVKDARSEQELQRAWDLYAPTLSWESLVAMAG